MKNTDYSTKTVYQSADIAKNYDRQRFTSLIGKFTDKIEKDTVRKLVQKIKKPALVLDVPCGTGRFSELLLSEGFKVVGSDISPEMLKIAGEKLHKYDNLCLSKADIENLPFDDNSIDCILCMRLMGHIPPPVRVKIERELGRVSRKSIIISYQNIASIMGLFKAVACFIKRDEVYLVSPSSLRKELKSLGLKMEKLVHVGLMINSNSGLTRGESDINRIVRRCAVELINISLKLVAQTYVVLIRKI